MSEHICHGGTWNNETKRFECEHTKQHTTDEPNIPDAVNDNSDPLEIVLARAYYRGLDKTGYSVHEMQQDKQAILDWHNKELKAFYERIKPEKQYPDHSFYGEYSHNQGYNAAIDQMEQNKNKELGDG